LQTGGLAFTPGHLNTEKLSGHIPSEHVVSSAADEPASDYKNIFKAKKESKNWKKPIALLLLLGGIVLAIWGGYSIYKRKTAGKTISEKEAINNKENKKVGTQEVIKNETDTNKNTNVNKPGSITIPAKKYSE